jgi:hypothetical protein
MISKPQFVEVLAEHYRRGAVEEWDSSSAGTGVAEISASSFLRSFGSRDELIALIVDISRAVKLGVGPDEVRQFLLTAPQYTVADLYDFLVAKRLERRSGTAYRIYKALIGLSALAAVYGLFQVRIMVALLAATIGSSIYGYYFAGGRK